MDPVATDSCEQEPTWWQDKQALVRYRLIAAWYGLRIRLMRPYGDVIGLIGLILAIVFFSLTIPTARLRIYGEGLAVVIVLASWPSIRYLGSLSTIMRAAASTEDGTRRVFDAMRNGMANAVAYSRLREIYTPLLEEANASLKQLAWPCELEFVDISRSLPGPSANKYASVILRTSGLADLSSLLGHFRRDQPDSVRSERCAENRQRLMRRWRTLQGREGIGDEEGRNYCLAEVRIEDLQGSARLALDLGAVKYGQIARTCEALVNEFALFSYLDRGKTAGHQTASRFCVLMRPSTMLHCLPWRRRAHIAAGSPFSLFLQPYKRAAGLGVAVATIVRSAEGECHVFVGERSEAVGTYPNVLHLIPAGNCNTHGSQRRLENVDHSALPDWYLRSIMHCEYLEEWFNDENLESLRILDWERRVDQIWADKLTEVAPIELTGLAFDLLNLRPEVCAKVTVKMTGTEVLNWEYTSGLPPEEWLLSDVGNIEPTRIVQSAAAALLLAQSSERSPEIREPDERSST